MSYGAVITVFFSYAKEDDLLCRELESRLSHLFKYTSISLWYKHSTSQGQEVNIEDADVILLLISADYLASDYLYGFEMKRAMERGENERAIVIPIILRPCEWTTSPLSTLQVLPLNGKPMIEWEDRTAAVEEIVQSILNLLRFTDFFISHDGFSRKLYKPPINIYFAYADEERSILKGIEEHLFPWMRQGIIGVWHREMAEAGSSWVDEMSNHLDKAAIILLLISPAFLKSDFHYYYEVERAMERWKTGEARVIPIIVRSCNWQEAPFSRLQALPLDNQPLTEKKDQEKVLIEISKGIRTVAEQLYASQEREFEHKRIRALLFAKGLLTVDPASILSKADALKELEQVEKGLEAAFEEMVAETKEQAHTNIQNMEKKLADAESQTRTATLNMENSERTSDIYMVIITVLLSCLLIIIFEFGVHWYQWKWLLEHPNSYGLQIGFDILVAFLTVCVTGFIRMRQRTKRLNKEELGVYLGILLPILAILIALLIGVFQLLGGPTH